MEQTAEAATTKSKRRFARKPAAPTNAVKPKTRASREAKQAAAPSADKRPRVTKAETVIGLLSRPEGATIAQMCEATGWQQHSVRGFLAGTVKKKANVALTSAKAEGLRIYRLTASESARA